MYRNVDMIIKKHFNVDNYDSSKKYNSIICSAYLSMCNVEVSEKTMEKRKDMLKYKQSMNKNANNKDLNEICL